MARPGEIEPKWWLVDATDKVVGRLASDIAMILMGKHRPTYTPHVDTGDFVVVINVEKIVFSDPNKWEEKQYTWYTGYPGLHVGDGRRAEEAQAGEDPLRGRPPHVAQEQAGLQDDPEAEDLRRQPASAPGPAARTQRTRREVAKLQATDHPIEAKIQIHASTQTEARPQRHPGDRPAEDVRGPRSASARARARSPSTAVRWTSTSTTCSTATPCWPRWCRPASASRST